MSRTASAILSSFATLARGVGRFLPPAGRTAADLGALGLDLAAGVAAGGSAARVRTSGDLLLEAAKLQSKRVVPVSGKDHA